MKEESWEMFQQKFWLVHKIIKLKMSQKKNILIVMPYRFIYAKFTY